IAKALADLGAEVTLVSGPTHLTVQHSHINLVKVISALQMYEACHEVFNNMDVVVAAAAVADYRPKVAASQKIKKQEATLQIELEKTQDISASMGAKKKKQFLVGFALETENEIENAMQKIQKKNLDLI